MSLDTAIAFALALGSTTLASLAYLREHDAAAALPALTLRHPLQSLRLLLTDRGWLLGFAMEGGGFALYAAALALAPLALVQSIAAGGIGLLAFLSIRLTGGALGSRHLTGVTLAVLGLVALAISLANGSGGESHSGSTVAVVVWICATVALSGAVIAAGRRLRGVAVANGIAGGLLLRRRHLHEARHAGRRTPGLRRAGHPRLHARHQPLAGRLSGGRRADRRRARDAAHQRPADPRRHDRARRARAIGRARRFAHRRVRRRHRRRRAAVKASRGCPRR
jgi:hypothetical protein